jgi:hypothetical protein
MGAPHFVNGQIRRALAHATDRFRALEALRRSALKQGDSVLAAACRLQEIVVEPDSERRWRRLRVYARETGSPFAIHVLATELARRGRKSDAERLWRFVRWEPSTDASDREYLVLARLFDHPVPTRKKMRRFLVSSHESARVTGDKRRAARSLRQLILLEQTARNLERERDLCEQLAQEEASPSAFQMLGIANERLGRFADAERAYRRAVRLALDGGDFAVQESLEAKLASLRSERRRGRGSARRPRRPLP